jgi:hypothetical protein
MQEAEALELDDAARGSGGLQSRLHRFDSGVARSYRYGVLEAGFWRVSEAFGGPYVTSAVTASQGRLRIHYWFYRTND